MKKFTTYILILIISLTILPLSTAATVTIETLTSVPVFNPAQCSEASISYMHNGTKSNISAHYIDSEQLTSLLGYFSGSNLLSLDINITEQIPSSNYPKVARFNIYNNAETGLVAMGKNYHFYFDRDRILVIKADTEAKVLYQGWFSFKDPTTYDNIMSVYDEIYSTWQQNNEEEENKLNTVQINDLKILYSGRFPLTSQQNTYYEWGVCSYKYAGNDNPVVMFYLDDGSFVPEYGYKYFYITSTPPVSNTLTIIPNRFVLYDYKTNTGKEQDCNTYWSYQLQINVTKDLQPHSIVITYGAANPTTDTIDMTQYAETGVFPSEYFSFINNDTDTDSLTTNEDIKQDNKQEADNQKTDITEEQTKEKDPTLIDDKKPEDTDKEETHEQLIENSETKIEIPSTTEMPEQTQDFFDVPVTHWAYDAIHNFSQSDIVRGYGNGYFGTDDSITYEHYGFLLERLLSYMPENMEQTPAIREEVIVSLVKALKIDVSNVDETIIDQTFSDCINLKSENKKYIAAAIENKLIIGANGKLFAENPLTRAETVVLLERALLQVKGL